MKRMLSQFGRTIAALILAATATSLTTASAQFSPEKGNLQWVDTTYLLVDSTSAVSRLVGTWTGTAEASMGLVKLRIKFLPDGSFKARHTELFIPNNYGSSPNEFVRPMCGQWKQEEQITSTLAKWRDLLPVCPKTATRG
ncbi:MAG: hypothetical protein Q8M16_23500 [Pirellulaceae bacterium]|nr:hypothetical protein [Pirellulaceae bacterium]